MFNIITINELFIKRYCQSQSNSLTDDQCSFNELVEKRQRAESKYNNVVFICQQANFADLVKACGSERVIQRGLQLEENLMRLIEDINDVSSKQRKRSRYFLLLSDIFFVKKRRKETGRHFFLKKPLKKQTSITSEYRDSIRYYPIFDKTKVYYCLVLKGTIQLSVLFFISIFFFSLFFAGWLKLASVRLEISC